MKVSFEGVGEQVLSFNKASRRNKGRACEDERKQHRKGLRRRRPLYGRLPSRPAMHLPEVKTAGYVELGYSGTAPAVGYATLAADAAAGKVKTVTSGGAQYLVIKVDTAAGTVGFIM